MARERVGGDQNWGGAKIGRGSNNQLDQKFIALNKRNGRNPGKSSYLHVTVVF